MTPPLPIRVTFLALSVALFAGIGLTGASPQSLHADEVPPFPSDPNAWLNSAPLSAEGLRGKGIVLYFFEEDCPRCRERWPSLLEIAKKTEGEPVMFIAVNSGSEPAKIQRYLREVKCSWPTILDTSREFERACQVPEISLQNIHQLRLVTATGSLAVGSVANFQATADKALSEGKWKIEPSGVPDVLKPVWQSVEIGNYKGVALALKKHLSSNKAEVKETATKLMELMEQDLDIQVKAFEEAQSAGNAWKAWQLCNTIPLRFQGMEMPKSLVSGKKDLMKDPKVKAGQAALKTIDLSRRSLTIGNPVQQKKTLESLEKIVSDFPDTDIARQAQSLIDAATKPKTE